MTPSPVMTGPDPLNLLFELVYSSLAVTISSLHFITTCMHNSMYIFFTYNTYNNSKSGNHAIMPYYSVTN